MESRNHEDGRVARLCRWPLARRLVVPLSVVVVLFSLAVSSFIVWSISARMDRGLDTRLAGLMEELVTGGLPLHQELLSRVEHVTEAQAVVLSREEAVAASTLPAEIARRLAEQVAPARGAVYVEIGDRRYRALGRRLPNGGESRPARLVLALSTAPVDRLKRELAWTIAAAASVGLLLLIAIVLAVVRTATRPLGQLARAVREVGRGRLDRTVSPGGGLEIETLAEEFNSMVGELERSRAGLLKAERLAVAGRVAANVAHEIRNPLSSIRMNLQLLQKNGGGGADELRDALDEIDRLDLAVESLLDLTARQRFDPRPGELNEIIEGTLRLARRKLAHLGIEVRTRLAGDLPQIPLDRNRMRQVVLNVLLNAADSMPGGGELRISTKRSGHAIEVSFEDRGAGLEDAVAGKAFEPFVSTKDRGAGLGLHVVRTIVELHGGSVALESAVPSGTRCVLRFPAPPAGARLEAEEQKTA